METLLNQKIVREHNRKIWASKSNARLKILDFMEEAVTASSKKCIL
jgi:hypothetical protein